MTTDSLHVAIIMDGNGRWAQKRGLPRVAGHEVGAQRVEEIIRCAEKYGVKYLTLYTFSKENWRRPEKEINFLMNLLDSTLDRKTEVILKNNVKFGIIGHPEDLPSSIQKKIHQLAEKTKHHTGQMLTLAFSYSSRQEMTEACKKIANKVLEGKLKPEEITETTISEHLHTAHLPDPDLLIRTSGEMRISNFLLWQISYTELYVTEKCWPEFNEQEFAKAIQEFHKRERRFGAVEVK